MLILLTNQSSSRWPQTGTSISPTISLHLALLCILGQTSGRDHLVFSGLSSRTAVPRLVQARDPTRVPGNAGVYRRWGQDQWPISAETSSIILIARNLFHYLSYRLCMLYRGDSPRSDELWPFSRMTGRNRCGYVGRPESYQSKSRSNLTRLRYRHIQTIAKSLAGRIECVLARCRGRAA